LEEFETLMKKLSSRLNVDGYSKMETFIALTVCTNGLNNTKKVKIMHT